MGYRSHEKAYGTRAAKYNVGLVKRAQEKEDDYYANRTIRPGLRQEDAADIMQYGERSDTDWETVVRDNLQQLRRTYAPRGDWAKRGDMDKDSQLLYDYMAYSQRAKMTKSQGRFYFYSPERGARIDIGRFDSVQQPSRKQRKGGGASSQVTYHAGVRGEEGYFSVGDERSGYTTISESQLRAGRAQRDRAQAQSRQYQQKANEALAGWMAAYNRNLNIREQIAISKRRVAQRERFADMQIQREKSQRKRTRDTLKTGTTGLATGVGTGLNIPS